MSRHREFDRWQLSYEASLRLLPYFDSLLIISTHNSTHSSQMHTAEPVISAMSSELAINVPASRWLLKQNVQRSVGFVVFAAGSGSAGSGGATARDSPLHFLAAVAFASSFAASRSRYFRIVSRASRQVIYNLETTRMTVESLTNRKTVRTVFCGQAMKVVRQLIRNCFLSSSYSLSTWLANSPSFQLILSCSSSKAFPCFTNARKPARFVAGAVSSSIASSFARSSIDLTRAASRS